MDSPGPCKKENRRTACGRNGCITLYKTDDCHLCDVMDSFVVDLMTQEGYSSEIINSIHKTRILDEPNIDEIPSVPAVRICDVILTGILDEDTLRRNIRRTANKKCFRWDCT